MNNTQTEYENFCEWLNSEFKLLSAEARSRIKLRVNRLMEDAYHVGQGNPVGTRSILTKNLNLKGK